MLNHVASIEFDYSALAPYCREATFSAGDVLRKQGQMYDDILFITRGAVRVSTAPRVEQSRELKEGAAIGEIGFLRGCTATATVTAKEETKALVIDGRTIIQLEEKMPALAAEMMRHLAQAAEERISGGLTMHPSFTWLTDKGNGISVVPCRGTDMLHDVQRLRYEVYCEELNRSSPFADHSRKTISDPLDEFAHIFVAVEGDETIGTMRLNLAAEGRLGAVEDVYGMKHSDDHPATTAVVTKFVVKRAKRRSLAAIKLITTVAQYCHGKKVTETYIDCIPALLPYYKALGFRETAPPFRHPENGISQPMKLAQRQIEKLSKTPTAAGYVSLYCKAKAIRWWNALDRIQFWSSRVP